MNQILLHVLSGLVVLSACSSAPMPTAQVLPGSGAVRILDLARGSGAAFALTVELEGTQFRLQASQDGSVAARKADVDHFTVFLFEAEAVPAGESSASLVGSPLTVDADLSKNRQQIVFKNVALTGPGKKYFVGLQARNAAGVNLTAETGVSLGGEPVAVSSKGGDGSGGLVIGEDYDSQDKHSLLTMTLRLRDAIGASLDTGLMVNDGNPVMPPTTISSP